MSDTITPAADLTIDTLNDGTFDRPDATIKQATVTLSIVKLPNGNGGVRFAADEDGKVLNTFYVGQDDWKALGMPTSIKVTVKAA